jgi:hypothetical protein
MSLKLPFRKLPERSLVLALFAVIPVFGLAIFTAPK